MNNTIDALRNLYVALGGEAADVANLVIIPELIDAIASLEGGGGSTHTITANCTGCVYYGPTKIAEGENAILLFKNTTSKQFGADDVSVSGAYAIRMNIFPDQYYVGIIWGATEDVVITAEPTVLPE